MSTSLQALWKEYLRAMNRYAFEPNPAIKKARKVDADKAFDAYEAGVEASLPVIKFLPKNS